MWQCYRLLAETHGRSRKQALKRRRQRSVLRLDSDAQAAGAAERLHENTAVRSHRLHVEVELWRVAAGRHAHNVGTRHGPAKFL